MNPSAVTTTALPPPISVLPRPLRVTRRLATRAKLLGDAAHDPRVRVERLVVVRPLSLVASGCLRSERRADERQRSHDLTVAADGSAADGARMAVVAGARPSIHTVDYHTGGEPFRIVTGGVPPLEGTTILERRRFAAEQLDDVRRLLVSSRAGTRTCTAAS